MNTPYTDKFRSGSDRYVILIHTTATDASQFNVELCAVCTSQLPEHYTEEQEDYLDLSDLELYYNFEATSVLHEIAHQVFSPSQAYASTSNRNILDSVAFFYNCCPTQMDVEIILQQLKDLKLSDDVRITGISIGSIETTDFIQPLHEIIVEQYPITVNDLSSTHARILQNLH